MPNNCTTTYLWPNMPNISKTSAQQNDMTIQYSLKTDRHLIGGFQTIGDNEQKSTHTVKILRLVQGRNIFFAISLCVKCSFEWCNFRPLCCYPSWPRSACHLVLNRKKRIWTIQIIAWPRTCQNCWMEIL